MATLSRDPKLKKNRLFTDDATFVPGDYYYSETKNQAVGGQAAIAAACKVWGIVDPRTTSGRDSPPNIAIFDTSDTFFDKGHLFASELGGGDDQTNLVPQFRFCNQNGAWKQFENSIKQLAIDSWKANGSYLFFHVEAEYTVSGLVPSNFKCNYSRIEKARLTDPSVVSGWSAGAPADKRQDVSSKTISNILQDDDLRNTGVVKVKKEDDAHWVLFQYGSVLHTVEQTIVDVAARDQRKRELISEYNDRAGAPPTKKNMEDAIKALAVFKAAALDRNLLSPNSLKQLVDMDDFIAGRADVPGAGQSFTLEQYVTSYSRPKNVLRRMSSGKDLLQAKFEAMQIKAAKQ